MISSACDKELKAAEPSANSVTDWKFAAVPTGEVVLSLMPRIMKFRKPVHV